MHSAGCTSAWLLRTYVSSQPLDRFATTTNWAPNRVGRQAPGVGWLVGCRLVDDDGDDARQAIKHVAIAPNTVDVRKHTNVQRFT